MRRREFISLFFGATAMGPLARAQPTEKMRRIGVLMAHREDDPEFQEYLGAFRQGLKRLGWIEGTNYRLETRWGALDDAQVRQRSAKELLSVNPDIILTQNTPPTASMLQETRTVPVVFVIVADPVRSGFVKSLSRPGGTRPVLPLWSQPPAAWLELLKDVAPQTKRAAFLFNPRTAPYANYYLGPFKAAAVSLGVEAVTLIVENTPILQTVFAAQAEIPNTGLIMMPDGFLNVHRTEVVSLAARYHLPAIYPWKFFTELGGLMSYGFDQREFFVSAATYIDRILKGEKPADLPVQAPAKYELVINRGAAKALGLTL